MNGSHDDHDPVLNKHIVSLDWYRIKLSIGYAFDAAWDIELEIPYDIKDQSVRYELPDGTEFFSPSGELHHRSETLTGLADFQLLASYRILNVVTKSDFLRIGVGMSLPVGKTEPNPYALADAGLIHQHIQFGTGTVDPIARLTYGWSPGTVGAHGTVGVRIPLYENEHGLLNATAVDYSIGPNVAIAPWISTSLQYTGIWQSFSYWNGERDPNSGFFLQGISLMLPISVGSWIFRPMVLYVFDISVPEGDNFRLEWMFSFTVEANLGGREVRD